MISDLVEIGQLVGLFFIILMIIHYGGRLPKRRKSRRPKTVKEVKAETPPKYRARANSNTELYDREKFGG